MMLAGGPSHMEMAGSRLLPYSFTSVLPSSCPGSSSAKKEKQGWVHTMYYAVESCTSSNQKMEEQRHGEFLNTFLTFQVTNPEPI